MTVSIGLGRVGSQKLTHGQLCAGAAWAVTPADRYRSVFAEQRTSWTSLPLTSIDGTDRQMETRTDQRRNATTGVHGNGEDWDPMGMGVRSAMGWEWDGNGN